MEVPARPRILRLPPSLANQIAAGEVVERPASVVKELVENCLDAGATQVVIDVERGGTALIRVRDDGGGIPPEDLPLALAPHATSKIRDSADLARIVSLGFRGEALASIASVSRLCVTSNDGSSAWSLDGSEAEPKPASHPQGTTIEVRDLFYNVPARRKFLRSETTEFVHLEQMVKRLALSRFDVGFVLTHNGRNLLNLRPVTTVTDRATRIAKVIGRTFVAEALTLDLGEAALRLHGWVAPPDAARPQADQQYFYLNGRWVRDKLLTHAVRLALDEALPEGRHPAYVLFLELDPVQVDVNVHPTKHEVRFREARLVHDFLVRALREAASPVPATVDAAAPPWAPSPLRSAVADTGPAYAASPVSIRKKARGTARIANLLHDRFALAEADGEWWLVDLAALREARALARLRAGSPARPLLVPAPVRLGAAAVARLTARSAELRPLGFEFDALADDTVMLRGVPAVLADVDPSALASALAGEAADDVQRTAAQAAAIPAHPPTVALASEWLEEAGPLDAGGWAVRLTADRLSSLISSGGER